MVYDPNDPFSIAQLSSLSRQGANTFFNDAGFTFSAPDTSLATNPSFTAYSGPDYPGPVSRLDPIWADYLEEDTEVPYYGALQRANPTPNQLAFFKNQRKDVFNQFLGEVDQIIRGGGVPDIRWADYLTGNTPQNFSFQRNFRQMVPSTTQLFAPRTSVHRR
jgi:hypothetical protein